ncbi:hypothetical protein SAMN05421823_102534 [Catalinimonas alkaloidigena]|uniref:Phage major capsid protein E n=1 Tax=Catalinimonas alkaloidigena TaxID=1075417 RepID=A0A1G9B766_9BACT|nr:hypothetical protein [Catalinimonas alkaloidigena]SDK35333.1 hypothetical protein SAMN05421823_102534 [Catalinimonas alkaloidigena]
MDIADIITEFGAYYLGPSQEANRSRIVQQLFQAAVTAALFTTMVTDATIYRASEARIGKLLQPFQKAWTPRGEAQFVPIAIEQFKMKADLEEYPDDLEATWLGFLADNSLDRKTWPFVRWFVESLVIPQIKEDEELDLIYNGVYAAPTPGTAGAVGTSMDGLGKIIADQITAGRITPITLGAIDADDKLFVKQVEDFVDQINSLYRNAPMTLGLSETLERRYLRGYRELYGKDTDYAGAKRKVDFTNITMQGLPSMAGKSRIWCSPKSNLVRLTKKTGIQTPRIENVDRKVKLYTDYWQGVGMLIPEIFFCNELV